MNKETILKIDKALTYHTDYNGCHTGRYLKIVDSLVYGRREPTLSQRVSGLINDYMKEVGVDTFDEALERVRKLNGEAK